MEHEKDVQFEQCDYIHTHQDIVDAVNAKMPEEEVLYDLAELFKVFADSTRIRILYVLFESEMCVCDIATALHMQQSAISHQLRVLRNARLVKFRKAGKEAFYSLDDDHVVRLMSQGLEHVLHG